MAPVGRRTAAEALAPRRQLPEGQPGTGLPATGRLHPLLGLETSDVENPGEPVISKRSHGREKQHVTM